MKEKFIVKERARAIAESQNDLGGLGQENMILALSHPEIDVRCTAFEKCDPITQRFITLLLEAETWEDVESDLKYEADQYRRLLSVVETFVS